MRISRRSFIAAAGAATAVAPLSFRKALAVGMELPHTIAAESPWFCNQVALTSKGEMFFGLPRYPDYDKTPCLAKRGSDGKAAAFPGNGWNDWKPGDDGRDSFVYVNSIHIFKDDTVWAVDQGALRADSYPPELSEPKPGAQKLVQLDPNSGRVLKVLRFDDSILPKGAKMNDLRIFGNHVYVTDSGIGALIYHNLSTGQTLRRMSGLPQMQAKVEPNLQQGNHQTPKIDMIEISDDGEWIYAAAPTGPFIKIKAAAVRDASISDTDLAKQVEEYAPIARSGGCALDTKGNLYLSELDNKRVTILSPTGQTAVLTSDEEFISPDGSFISIDRKLYIPITQSRRTRLFGNKEDMVKRPWKVYVVDLPEEFGGIKLGNSLNGVRAG
ncbi:major royal jelly protein [Rhizobium sp. CF080]|uniref:L-dopachrome tautomerase-related protein n=1 Tax=Rhizobium sp. (strain CF080) TaxID=1144310 RepID=UPI00027188B4|nr:L-dopachrome tautomerase-related protein [Rhizobium sp. CF080]EUB99300.1 major royal jelly protein [Rhizobium sp. CF080]